MLLQSPAKEIPSVGNSRPVSQVSSVANEAESGSNETEWHQHDTKHLLPQVGSDVNTPESQICWWGQNLLFHSSLCPWMGYFEHIN